MRLGLSTPIVQQLPARSQPWERDAGARELLRVVEEADRLGFAWISCSDHVAVPRSQAAAMGSIWFEPIATLAFCAARTARIRLLTHVLVLPYRHPLLLAKSIATVDRLSGGRIVIGVGSGHLKPEFRSLGLDHARRGEQTAQVLRGLRCALESECSAFEGAFSRWRDMVVAPPPIQQPRPPIWVGGNGPRALRRALELGDGWIPWEIDIESFRALARQARAARPAIELVAPVAFAAADSAADFGDRLATWVDAGATAFHVAIEHRSLDHLLDRLAALAPLTRVGITPGR